jgi:two-component system, OmpR family, response regulator MprA
VRVLIVEDDEATREVLDRGLREELFHVESVADGAAAEARAVEDGFDLIVLDVMLPGHDGFMVCRRLRVRGVDTPILLLTGRDGLADRVRGLDAGADDYLAKPFAFEELFARVRALTRRGRTKQTTAVLSYGPIELDQRDLVAKVNGTTVILSATEYRLLEYFLLRAEVLLTRDELARHVWGTHADLSSNVIDVYVSYLRKKLQPAGVPLLRTVRSLGYILRKDDP